MLSLWQRPGLAQKGSVKRLGSGSGDLEVLFYKPTRTVAVQVVFAPRLLPPLQA